MAQASQPSWVAKGGKRVPITRSTSEYGVVLKSCHEADECARRMEAQGTGRLEAFPNAPTSKVRLLRVAEVSIARRSVVRQDPAIQEVRPVYRIGERKTLAIGTGTLLVKTQPNVPHSELEEIWKTFNVTAAEAVDGLPNVYKLTPREDEGEISVAEALSSDARIVWAQPNFRRPLKRTQATPADPLFNQQWHLNNTGQLGGTSGADIDALEAWAISDGQDILIGLFDDGVDVDHEDLRDGFTGTGHDPSVPSNDPGFDDPRPKLFEDFHGTAVAGLALARANSVGGRGVAFGSRFTASRGLGELLSDAELASVFTFARQQEVDVHINSWGLDGHPPNPQIIIDAIELNFDQGRDLGDLDGDGEDDAPRGMVIVFASGNDGVEIETGFDLSTIPEVISIGASGDDDFLAGYSNFGTDLDLVAPSGVDFRPALITTDVTDAEGNPAGNGFNDGGVSADGFTEIDAAGKYTDSFAGTSAAAPVAAGVAALVLSANPALTARDVRIILEHTADKVSTADASYHGVTSRSRTYGYGRINAGGAGEKLGAVEAAVQAISNGGLTWPDRPADVNVTESSLRWVQGSGTDEFLVVEADADFDFAPIDGLCYDSRQLGCSNAVITALPTGVRVLSVGCELTCTGDEGGSCETGDDQCVDFLLPTGKKFFGIYGRSRIGRYSFGVAADSDGDVIDSGGSNGGSSGGSNGGGSTSGKPSVTISVTPLEGTSPLRVNFNGNAVSDKQIDESRTTWDFDISDGITTEANTRMTSHVYTAPAGQTKTYFARLTMFDVNGQSGFAQVGITVEGQATDDGNVGENEISIIVSLPGTSGSDVNFGKSPFEVLLSVDASGLAGTLQSVVWDLGDGSDRVSSLLVPHTYINQGTADLRIPITATVTTVTSGSTTLTSSTTRIITVQPGTAEIDPGDPQLPGTTPLGEGGSAIPCAGGIGLMPFFLLGLAWVGMRRRVF